MNRLKKIILGCVLMLSFLTGFLSCYAVNSMYIDIDSPILIGFGETNEQPGDWLDKQNIRLYPDRIVVYVKNPVLSEYADTGSMLPTLGENANGIKIKPSSAEQINIGDIISYKEGDKMIVHRVIAKGEDSKGIYFVPKGDNNTETDGKVYWEDVKYVTIMLIY